MLDNDLVFVPKAFFPTMNKGMKNIEHVRDVFRRLEVK